MVNSLQIIKILSFHLNFFFFFEIHIMYFCQRKHKTEQTK